MTHTDLINPICPTRTRAYRDQFVAIGHLARWQVISKIWVHTVATTRSVDAAREGDLLLLSAARDGTGITPLS
jgi:hypothetical protein